MDSLALSASAGVDWQSLWLAVGLLVLAVALLVLELFVVSFGVLQIGSGSGNTWEDRQSEHGCRSGRTESPPVGAPAPRPSPIAHGAP